VPVPSLLWRCWLGRRKGIRPVKNWVVRCWRGYLSGARCRLAYAQLMPLPLTISCSSKIQIGFAFLVPAHPGSPGKRAVKRVCVHTYVRMYVWSIDQNPMQSLFQENHLYAIARCQWRSVSVSQTMVLSGLMMFVSVYLSFLIVLCFFSSFCFFLLILLCFFFVICVKGANVTFIY